MARISAILFSRHCHRAIIFYISATAMRATFISSRQWPGGAKSGASAQHWLWGFYLDLLLLFIDSTLNI